MKLFEVKKNGKIYFQTDYKECTPDTGILKSMKKSGYKVYYNGRMWKDGKNG